MLVLVPAHCKCSATVSWLICIASGAHARTYLVYTTSTETDVKQAGSRLGSQIRAQASLALEPRETLRSGIPGSCPTMAWRPSWSESAHLCTTPLASGRARTRRR